ncbi:hypothetical protein FXO38_33985 [Capsicum annuum]|nr:hypothetical protein FXO38_33985 [Capsicum annuum]
MRTKYPHLFSANSDLTQDGSRIQDRLSPKMGTYLLLEGVILRSNLCAPELRSQLQGFEVLLRVQCILKVKSNHYWISTMAPNIDSFPKLDTHKHEKQPSVIRNRFVAYNGNWEQLEQGCSVRSAGWGGLCCYQLKIDWLETKFDLRNWSDSSSRGNNNNNGRQGEYEDDNDNEAEDDE